jgi:hypothetical protein
MSDAALNSSIAEYRELHITMRDDINRFGTVLSGDTLTTVMGTAFRAGVMGSAETLASLTENNVLQAMLSTLENKDGVLALIADLIEGTTTAAGKAAVMEAKNQIDMQVIAPMNELMRQAASTMTRIEASSKLLLAGAEAKANLITRKRQEAQSTFTTSLELVKDKSKIINILDVKLDQMSKDLNDASTDGSTDQEAMYKRIAFIANAQRALGNQKDLAKQQMINHFGDQTGVGKSNKELINLTIPENIEQGKGKELMANFENYINGRADQYYALMPYLMRELEDYDHSTGACFKPPCTEEKTDEIPVEIRSNYVNQSKTLYVAIMAKLSDTVKSLVKATFEYGVTDIPARCAENDGPNLLFALICMFRPCNVEYTEELESTFMDAHHAFHGNDPREVIKGLREPLIEAQNLQVPLKWKQCGKRIVDYLSFNDHNMGEALKNFKKLEVADKDSTAQLDKLFAAIEAQCKRNEKHDGKSTAFGMRLIKREEPDSYDKDADTLAKRRAKQPCWNGDACKKLPNCPFLHEDRNKKGAEGKGSRKSRGGKAEQPSANPTTCLGIGCPAKAPRNKKLCTTCFMKAVEASGPTKLEDGSTFTKESPERFSKSKFSVLKNAMLALAGYGELNAESDDEEDEDQKAPVGVGGPASSSKRKRANTAKATDDAQKRVKEFAESLGVELN